MMLIVAAIVVILTGVTSLRARADFYESQKRHHFREWERMAMAPCGHLSWHVLRKQRAVREFHFVLSQKYEKALLRPWLPVATDPPEAK
jgi:hypothetical protein